MTPTSYKSCAKVNLGLQIRNQRSDGYHNINTVFHEIDFHDLITINNLSEIGYDVSLIQKVAQVW